MAVGSELVNNCRTLQDMFKNKDDNEDLELHNHAGHLQDIMHKVCWGCFPSTNPKLGMVIYLSIYLDYIAF
jgi:hypothetical protein